MRTLLYWALTPLLLLAFIIGISLLSVVLGLVGGTAAILAESFVVGVANFISYFVSEARAVKIRKWLTENGISLKNKD